MPTTAQAIRPPSTPPETARDLEDRIARAADALDEEAQYRYERSATLERQGDRMSAAFAKQRGRELQDLAEELRGGRS